MNLREWLFKKRMRICYLAAVLHVDRTYIHRWMKGSSIPSEKIMSKIREITLDEVHDPADLKDIQVDRRNDG